MSRKKGKMAKTKGKAGERQFAEFLQSIVEADGRFPLIKFERNLWQSAEGGFDITGVDSLAIEVKRCETLNLSSWWKQTLDQANRVNYSKGLLSVGSRATSTKTPLLGFRKNRQPWQIVLSYENRCGVQKKIGRYGPYVKLLNEDQFKTWLINYLLKQEKEDE